ncbi:MAG: heme biosynthesis protein HemY [Proteobacteria bacterium]|nr:heme biosynthesis protein HemY [Pseudomonadota bacterium]MDA1059083.1 heme biosynthesis protein HemY [Pseudomonadota bacterium]
MSRAITAFVLLIVLGVLAAWIADRPGQLGLDWQGYRVEMPVGLGIGAAVVAMVVAAILYQVWRWVRRGPADLAQARAKRRHNRGQLALTRGMVAVAAGDRAAALRFSREAERYLAETPLTMLLAAQAAQLSGDDKAARRYFSAMLKRPELEFLGLRGLVGQANRSGDRAGALTLARRAYALNPQAPWVLSALFDLEARAGNWREAERVVTRAVTSRALGESEGRRRQAIAGLHIARDLRDKGDTAAARKTALKAHALEPGLMPATLLAVDLLGAAGKRRRALHLIEQAWQLAPHAELAAAHRHLFVAEDAKSYLQRVNHLVGPAPAHDEARRVLAAAALEAGQTERAAEVLGALADEPNAEALMVRLKASIEERAHGPAAARPWLERVATAPEPGWTCNVCTHRHDAWVAHCTHCETFDSLRWGVVDGVELAKPEGARHLPPVDADAAQAESPGVTVLRSPPPLGSEDDDDPLLRAAG